jgi:hypothetical protein
MGHLLRRKVCCAALRVTELAGGKATSPDQSRPSLTRNERFGPPHFFWMTEYWGSRDKAPLSKIGRGVERPAQGHRRADSRDLADVSLALPAPLFATAIA